MSRDCMACEFNTIDEWEVQGRDGLLDVCCETRCLHKKAPLPYPDNVLPNWTETPPEWCPLGAEDDDD